jgi:hypothetical protein
VPGDRRRLQACFAAQGFDAQYCHLPVDLSFDPYEANQRVELGQQLPQFLGFGFWLGRGLGAVHVVR